MKVACIELVLRTRRLVRAGIALLEDGAWHQEQHIASHLAREAGISEQEAFHIVIRVWHAIEERIERRLDKAVLDFQWRLRASDDH